MNKEQDISENLTFLKKLKSTLSIKVDFEGEYYSEHDFERVKKIIKTLNVPLTVKIGGCQAVQDIYEAKNLSAKAIVAPMIETEYALLRFIETTKEIYSSNLPELFINIETITAYKNLDAILNSECAKSLHGIVIGRTDFVQSMGMSKNEVNSKQIFNIVQNIISKAKDKELICTVGGNISYDSIEFLNNLKCLDFFETRQLIFKQDENQNKEELIKKSLEFEINWLQQKNTLHSKNRAQELLRRLS